MANQIVMPQLGESIAEGTIVKWLKNVGDAVAKDENVLLISTDKVEAEIPSPSTGVLVSIDVGPGKTVNVGTVLGSVGQAGETPVVAKTAPPPSLREGEADVAIQTNENRNNENSRFLSPLVRKIASENRISDHELSSLPGSGRDNRITKNDLLAYVKTRQAGPVCLAPATPVFIGEDTFKPVSTMRRVIMENMISSRRNSAHVTTFFEIDFTQIDRVRHQFKDQFKAQEGISLTYTTFIAAATCVVLKRHPYINAEIQGDKIKFKRDVHLGMAVAIDQPEPGLMVPVIKNADQMNIRGLARTINDLATRTRTRKIKPDELSGGSFTITNPGNYGAIIGTPIINQPQVAILGVGQIKKQAVVIEVDGTDTMGIRNMGWLALSFDHRLIDGATADIFMADLKKTLETWSTTP